jgi:hypothetical protein
MTEHSSFKSLAGPEAVEFLQDVVTRGMLDYRKNAETMANMVGKECAAPAHTLTPVTACIIGLHSGYFSAPSSHSFRFVGAMYQLWIISL